MSLRAISIVAIWATALALALCIDRPVAAWVHDSGLNIQLKTHWRTLLWLARRPGNFLTFTLPAAVGVVLLGRRFWKSASFILLSGLLVAFNGVVKWIVGRPRPFQGEMFAMHPFVGGWHGLGGPNQSFPSGDVCLAAATAVSLSVVFPRLRWVWAALVVVVAVERVAEGAHFPSDAVAACGLGWTLSYIAWRLLGRPAVKAPMEG